MKLVVAQSHWALGSRQLAGNLEAKAPHPVGYNKKSKVGGQGGGVTFCMK